MTEGVDYAWQRPAISALLAAGKLFACRYGGPGSAGKQLDPVEAAALNAAGISIVANAEGAADGLLGGRAAGRDWASRAETHFATCGMPPDRPIYLSVDFNVTAAQWLDVANALRGAGEILGPDRVGVYGGLNAVRWARRDNVANWFWQTYAWSGGVWAAGNHIEQYKNGMPLGGATLDLDRAYPADYGQWGVGDMVTPAEVWSYQIASASLNMPPTAAADWLKQGLAALRETKAINTELDTVRAQGVALDTKVTGLETKLDQVLVAIAAGLSPAQLTAVATAAEAGAEKGVDDALDGATITTTIDVAQPTP